MWPGEEIDSFLWENQAQVRMASLSGKIVGWLLEKPEIIRSSIHVAMEAALK